MACKRQGYLPELHLTSHHLHAGEDEVTREVLSTIHLAWQGHVQEQGPGHHHVVQHSQLVLTFS